MLTGTDADDPRLGLGDCTDGASSLSCTIHLGQDDTGDPDGVVESLGLRSGLLTDLGIQHEESLVGLGSCGDVLQFLDEVILQGVTSRGIDYDDLLVLEVLHSVLDDLGGILLSGFTVDIDAHLLTELA